MIFPFKSTAHGDDPFEDLKAKLPQFNSEIRLNSKEFNHYLRFYKLDIPKTQHFAGYIQASGFNIFTHLFKPEQDKLRGSVFIVHGYFVHSGFLRYIIPELLQKQYQVITIDLPGHGLSSGEKVAIDSFSQYSQVLDEVLTKLKNQYPQPLHLIAHSTGGAAVIDYLLNGKNNQTFDKIILASPLVQSFLWNLSKVGYFAAGSWINELPRWTGNTSSDPEFLAFVKIDPLQHQRTPVKWFKALLNWNKSLKKSTKKSNYHITIIQGKQDTVVDWPYNINFLKQHFVVDNIHLLDKAKHDLFWEKPVIRKRVFDIIHHQLED